MTPKGNVVSVTLLGIFSVGCNGQKVSERVMSVENQSWQLIKYMLVNAGRVVTMDDLVKELSFSGRVADAGNTIRVRLRRSRRILEAVGLGAPEDGLLLYGGDRFWINPRFSIRSDTRKIDACYMSVTAGDGRKGSGLSQCVRGLTCFTGKYLEYSKPSEWILKTREHYDNVYLQLWGRCVELMEKTGDYSRASAVWQNALKLMPLRPELHVKLLKGLLKKGLVAEAATYYSKWAIALANTELRPPDFKSLLP